MVTFLVSLVILVLGYIIYGGIIERVFRIDPQRLTPALTMSDGVDYVPMKPWRIFLIQFLNIAGVGPICGAIMGAKFGTASFIWIVFGSIFAGAVHDFLAGMISLRNNGCSLPDIHGKYLGKGMMTFMRGFMVLLMILVGVVFVNTPATLLQNHFTPDMSTYIWVAIILCYYLIATLLPIDKLIGRIYPLFGFLLIVMAIAIVCAFFIYRPAIPEIWSGLGNRHPDAANYPVFPMMCISIACGAISGFHATQSPLMARCMTNEKQGRPIFYGAMITEGVVALIWAAAAIYFFSPESGIVTDGKNGPAMVGLIAETWFPKFIAVITILGVISAAVTSGDTALRSARLIIADMFHFDQKPIKNRLIIAIPMFLVTLGVLIFSLADAASFDIIWRYFAWSNQFLATITLCAITVFLIRRKKLYYLMSLLPALFMVMVCSSYIFIAPEGFSLPHNLSYILGGVVTLIVACMFVAYIIRIEKNKTLCEE